MTGRRPCITTTPTAAGMKAASCQTTWPAGYAIKLFERDEKGAGGAQSSRGIRSAIESTIKDCEAEMDDDAESIITNQRYAYINRLVSTCVKKAAPRAR